MENKVVCYYCGTIYDEARGKCPLCGSTARSAESAESVRPAPRRTPPENRRPSNGGRKKPAAAPKGVKIASVLLLALAVLVVFYFIGDMIGWWPGPEDNVERTNPLENLPSKKCETLTLDAELLEFQAAGETKKLTASVNLSCSDELYCNSADPSIAQISPKGETGSSATAKTVTFTVTAVNVGETEIRFQCGDKTASCKVVCGSGGTSVTAGEDYRPELNSTQLTFTKSGDTTRLSVTNLPFNEQVLWRSGDEDIASVSEDGTVTAVGEGSTTITAEVAGKTVEATVRCEFTTGTTQPPDNDGAHLEKTDVTVRVDEKFDLYLYNSDGKHIDGATYTVEDPEICKVEDCYVTALASGTTEVIVTYNGQEYRCIVRVS